MAKMNDAQRYITRIKNHDKQTYAWRYYYWLCGCNQGNDNPHPVRPPGLCMMGAQAVEMRLREYMAV